MPTTYAQPETAATNSNIVAAPVSNLKVKQSELILFTTQLSVMLESGVVLSDALEAIAQQMRPGTFKIILTDIAVTINSGESFSLALTP